MGELSKVINQEDNPRYDQRTHVAEESTLSLLLGGNQRVFLWCCNAASGGPGDDTHHHSDLADAGLG